MRNQTEATALFRVEPLAQRRARISSLIRWATLQFVLVLGAAAVLAGCTGGPPLPPPPEDPAQAKADAKAREDFARSLPKPPER